MSKGNAATVVRGMDFGTSFLSALTKGAEKRGISDETLYAKMKDGAMVEKVLDLFGADSLRAMEALGIHFPAIARPTLQDLQKIYPWIRRIENDNSPEGAFEMNLATVLELGENSIGGQEYERRRASAKNRLLGFQHAVWLKEHQDEFPEFMRLLGNVYIDFPGIIVVDGDGDRLFPSLDQSGGSWDVDWHWYWNDSYLLGSGRIAVSGK